MARRGRKKKFKLNLKFDVRPDVIKSVAAMSLMVLGIISLISYVASDYEINAKIQDILGDKFGITGLIVPFILAFAGLLLIDSIKFKFKDLRVWFGLIGTLFSVAGTLGLLNMDGGELGDTLAIRLTNSVSTAGAAVILLAVFAISLFLMFNVSINQVVTFIGGQLGVVKGLDLAKVRSKREESPGDEPPITFPESTPDIDAQLIHAIEEKPKKGSPKEDNAVFEVMPPLAEPQMDKISVKPKEDFSSLTSIAPNLPYSDRVWELPPLDLLEDSSSTPPDVGNVKERAAKIKDTLKSFGVDVEVADIKPGPSVTQYALRAATGTKISKISTLQYDLALALASPTGSVRIEAPIPGKALIGIEVPNNNRSIVSFKSLLTSESMKAVKSKLATVMGKDVGGQTVVYDIAKMPHMLVAGATGSGKSVFLHSLIFSILYRASPQECKFIFIDPKRVELVHYRDIPHLMSPVITEIDKAASVFKWAVVEMERRYKLFESAKARNIDSYNEKSGFQALPYIVIVVDELAEIMVADPAAVEKSIIRIAQLARATGIHLVLSVQRPSTNVITGLIKANIPCRVAFNVSSQVDSRVIIDQPGAEKLLGKGDMLFMAPDASKPVRLQGSYVSDKEIANLVSYLKAQGVSPEYKEEVFEAAEKAEMAEKSVAAGGESVDDLYDEAVEVVVSAGKASASLLQRRLSIGYARAARILDELEENGVIGVAQGSKPRDVLIKPEDNGFSSPISEIDGF